MSKLAVVIAVPALAAAAGLAVLSLDLLAQVEDLEARLHDLETSRPAARAETSTEPVVRDGLSRAEHARVRSLEERLAAVEQRAAAAQQPDEEARHAAPVAAAGAAPAPHDATFRSAVEAVLDAREAERRLERLGRVADARTRQLLRGVAVSETRDMDLEPELERGRSDELRQALERSLESILDAHQMDAVRPRLDLRRGGDGGRRPGRRPGSDL